MEISVKEGSFPENKPANPILQNPTRVEKQRENFIKLLENNTLLDPQDKASLLLVYLGVKPATGFIIPVKYDSEEKRPFDYNKETFQDDIGAIEELLLESGLPKKSEIVISGRKLKHLGGQKFSVGKDRQSLEELLNAKDDITIGHALGYPESALEGYGGDKFDTKVLSPEELKIYKAYKFFYFSNENWKQELEKFKEWVSMIEKASPKLHQEILQDEQVTPSFPDGYEVRAQ